MNFPLLDKEKVIYLDNAATTQKPQQVLDAINNHYEHNNANVHRGMHVLATRATDAYEGARKKVAKFINASPEEIIFTRGATESLNLAAYSIAQTLKDGDEIIMTEMEHHSNLVPWQQIAKKYGLKVRYIRFDDDYRLDMDHARRLITEKTKVVSVVHVSNTLGTINPAKELCKLAHEKGALFILDAAQSAPHMKIDVKDLDADFLAFSGHKMLGPTGIGVFYGKKSLLDALPPFNFGGQMIEEVSFEDSSFKDPPHKFEAGTPNIAGAVGLGAAVDCLNDFGMDKLEKCAKDLTGYGLEELKKIEKVRIIGPQSSEDRAAVFSIDIEGMHPHDVCHLLDKEGIAARGGHHCTMPLMKKLGLSGTTRASLYLYNTKEDIDKLVTALKKAIKVFE